MSAQKPVRGLSLTEPHCAEVLEALPGLVPIQAGMRRALTTDWSLIDPAHIANTCSPRHVQSVLEDAKQTIGELLASARAAERALDAIAAEMTVGERYTNAGQHLVDALPFVRAGIAKATRGAA